MKWAEDLPMYSLLNSYLFKRLWKQITTERIWGAATTKGTKNKPHRADVTSL
jgi:hypothetical protein